MMSDHLTDMPPRRKGLYICETVKVVIITFRLPWGAVHIEYTMNETNDYGVGLGIGNQESGIN